MYRRTPQDSAARRRLPPPSILSLRSVARAAAMSAGLLGREVSWSMTASAPDLQTASSTAAASSASTSATSAPSSLRPRAPASTRVIPVTAWPCLTSSAISGRPIAPVAPATKTFMVDLRSVLLLFRDDDVLDVVGVQHDGQDARRVLVAGVLRDAVQAAGRLVEGVTGLEDPGLVVVDRPLVLALDHVAEHGSRVSVRGAGVAGLQRHLDGGGPGLLAVELLGDVGR